jgi:hypothetical protein
MSEKRLITKEQIQQVYQRLSDYGDEVIEDIQDVFEYLPAPILADVTGKRKLEDMTEEEFEELLEVAGLDCKYVESNDNQNPNSMFKKYDVKCENNTIYTQYWHQNIDDWDENELEIEAGTVWMYGNYFNPVEVMKWFIEHGFNVFGEGK